MKTNEFTTIKVPAGATVTIMIDGKEMNLSDLVSNQYLFNSKTDRRWITAQTFRMLSDPKGWDAAYRHNGYMWQFKAAAEQLERMIKLESKNPEKLAEERVFFNDDVFVSLMNHYINQLKKYKNKNKEVIERYNEWSGKLYEYDFELKTSRWGIIRKDKFNLKIKELKEIIDSFKKADSLRNKRFTFRVFRNEMNKLPFETPMCPVFHDAFKGIGAYETMMNMIKYHECLLPGIKTQNESIETLKGLVGKIEPWRFHILLKETIEVNNFDLYSSEGFREWLRNKDR